MWALFRFIRIFQFFNAKERQREIQQNLKTQLEAQRAQASGANSSRRLLKELRELEENDRQESRS
ncbi:MAG: hypothetical protein HJJLKODD_00674 [Phycisphaerae bacterium]|nr:hypothetical protein [Phycisphaerae bacterium]